MSDEIQPKYSKNKSIQLAIKGLILLCAILILGQFFTWLGPIFGLGMGIWAMMFSIPYVYYAWMLDQVEFAEWQIAQQTIQTKQVAKALNNSAFNSLWAARLIAPLVALIGLFIAGAAIYWIFLSVFR